MRVRVYAYRLAMAIAQVAVVRLAQAVRDARAVVVDAVTVRLLVQADALVAQAVAVDARTAVERVLQNARTFVRSLADTIVRRIACRYAQATVPWLARLGVGMSAQAVAQDALHTVVASVKAVAATIVAALAVIRQQALRPAQAVTVRAVVRTPARAVVRTPARAVVIQDARAVVRHHAVPTA